MAMRVHVWRTRTTQGTLVPPLCEVVMVPTQEPLRIFNVDSQRQPKRSYKSTIPPYTAPAESAAASIYPATGGSMAISLRRLAAPIARAPKAKYTFGPRKGLSDAYPCIGYLHWFHIWIKPAMNARAFASVHRPSPNRRWMPFWQTKFVRSALLSQFTTLKKVLT